MDLRELRFGIELEMTGITRRRAAQVIADHFHTEPDGEYARDTSGRVWKATYDGSIDCQKRAGGRLIRADGEYSTEVVSPILVYDDIPVLQDIIRELRRAGAFSNSSCGIHIHVDASSHTAQTLRNLTNIVAAKEDLIYKALKVDPGREAQYCRKTDPGFLERINDFHPTTLTEVERLWYNGSSRRSRHYDSSRYHCVNLHSVFSKGTVEFRLFNSDLRHAGKIKAYIQFCLAINAQAINQRSARPTKTQTTNDKYTFRCWLLRLGLIGDEFKTARKHLLDNLDGCIAWRDPAQAVRQRERQMLARQQEAEIVTQDPVPALGRQAM